MAKRLVLSKTEMSPNDAAKALVDVWLFFLFLSICDIHSDPPGEPEIHGQPETQLQSGDTLTLACLSRGGNPPARLDWFRNDVSVRSRYRQGTHEATATHSVVLVDRDDGAVFRCDASNSVTHQPLSTAITIHVTVRRLFS